MRLHLFEGSLRSSAKFHELVLQGCSASETHYESDLAKALWRYVRGVQAQKVLACAKHYVFNSQEQNRGGPAAVSEVVEDRAARQIFYKPAKFEKAQLKDCLY